MSQSISQLVKGLGASHRNGGDLVWSDIDGPCPADPRLVTRGSHYHHLQDQSGTLDELGEVAIGWLRGSFPAAVLQDVLSLLSDDFGEAQLKTTGLFGYRDSFTWTNGGRLLCTLDNGNKDPIEHATLDLPASVLEAIDAERLLMLFWQLDGIGFNASRIDTSYDDFDKVMNPADIFALAMQGDVSGFRKVHLHSSGDIGGPMGNTVCFGSRGSNGGGKFMRIYDKEAESKGEVCAIRYEVEWSDQHAKATFKRLAACDDLATFAQCIGESVGGAIDFRKRGDRPGDHHMDRCPRWEWWVSLLDKIGRTRTIVRRVKSTVYQSMKWIEKQVAKATARVAVYHRAKGASFAIWWRAVVQDGMDRMSTEDERKAIAEALEAAYVPI